MPVVTLDEAYDALNIDDPDGSQDAELQDLVDGVVAVVENLVGPVDALEVTEFRDGGGPSIVLSYYPVLSVTSVTEFSPSATVLASEPFGSTFTANGYRLNSQTGVLTRTSGGWPINFTYGNGNVQVVYTAGRATVPPSVRSAALELIRLHWQPQQSGNLPGVGDSDFTGGETVLGYYVPFRVLDQLAPERRAPLVA